VTAEVKQLTEQINKEWNELKAVLQGESKAQIDKFGKTLGDTEAKLVEISTRIGQLEVKAQRPSLEGFQRTVQADAAFEVAVKGLVRGGLDEEKAVERVKAHNAAMAKYLRKGEAAFTAEERKLMTVSDDSTGGFAASPEFDSTILKGVVEISPVRSLVRVRNTGKRSVKMMKRTGTFAAVWVGEIETRSETTGLAYGLEASRRSRRTRSTRWSTSRSRTSKTRNSTSSPSCGWSSSSSSPWQRAWPASRATRSASPRASSRTRPSRSTRPDRRRR
jgi:HK97 family phage major capsid protein